MESSNLLCDLTTDHDIITQNFAYYLDAVPRSLIWRAVEEMAHKDTSSSLESDVEELPSSF